MTKQNGTIVNHFSAQLKLIRQKSGLSQRELGAKLELSGSAITNWEGGRSSPTLHTLGVLSDVLGCRPRDLIDPASPNLLLDVIQDALVLLRGGRVSSAIRVLESVGGEEE